MTKTAAAAAAPLEESQAYARVGRLAAYGLEHPWQVALYLPQSYLDVRDPDMSVLSLDKKEKRPIRLRLVSAPSFGARSGPPRLQFTVRDGHDATYRASIFGDTQIWKDKLLQDTPQLFLATASEFNGALWVTIHQLLPDKYAGRIIPIYPRNKNPNGPDPEELRAMVARHLPGAIPTAAQHIVTQLEAIAPMPRLLDALNARGWSLDQLIQQSHYPHDPVYIEPVRATLQRLAALGSLAAAKSSKAKTTPNPLRLQSMDRRMAAMPFTLTSDQTNAMRDIAREVASVKATAQHIVAGDVGVGKTAVAGVVAACVADIGGTCMLLFPSTIVADQAIAAMRGWYPDLAMTLVTGDTGGAEDLSAPILMGTSALLHRKLDRKVDVLIVDEQHRWSRDQREHHRAPSTHLVELSATCIPRTQALARYGHVSLSEMRATHQPKFIETRLWVGQEATASLFLEIRHVIRQGSPVFVIYPKREKNADAPDRHNIEDAAERWEAMFPGKVITLTGEDAQDQKTAAIQAIRSGDKRILLCTTVVEVGVDVSNLRHIVIVNPQNYGLVQLHQLRGRVARAGGEGWCHLLAPDVLPVTSRDRLQALLDTTDGFKIAEADLRLRGAGDLNANSQRQHGADGNFLHGTKIDLDVYDQVLPLLDELLAGSP